MTTDDPRPGARAEPGREGEDAARIWGSVVGRGLFALVIAAMGVQCLLLTTFVNGLEPMPRAVAAAPWAWVTGAVLLCAALAVLWERTATVGALVLAKLFSLSVIVLYIPLLVADLKGAADDALHTQAIGAAALVLAAEIRRRRGDAGAWSRLVEIGSRLGVVVFGLCMIGFGVMHFVFFQFTADFVPSWIPLHRFWAAFTGVAQIAAGLAVLTGVLARQAAILAAAMYGSWALILHLPRALAATSAASEWTDMLIATGLCAGSLLVAGAVLAPRGRTP